MDVEMQTFRTSGNDGMRHVSPERVKENNGDGVVYRIPDLTETDELLAKKDTSCNGEKPSGDGALNDRLLGNARTPREVSFVNRTRKQLNQVVFLNVRLWMVFVVILLLIFAVIIISLVICAVLQEDVDENYDHSLFKVPLYFNGSFQMPKQVFTEELFTLSSNESRVVASDLQKQLADLYTASPALGRYFFKAEIVAFRNGSVVADYQLTFLMPEDEDEQDQLRNATLSRNIVYNVFRQFLYDQESEQTQDLYIDPGSLKMF